MKTRITELFGIQYPIIQGGMVWASGWQLVTAVSNAGGLGLLGSGSMSSEELRAQIRQCKAHTVKPFGVNVPIMYEKAVYLIQKGKAFVDDLTAEEIREYRGDFTTPGKESPYRNRPIEENLALFHQMNTPEAVEGSMVLRAKLDMANDNMHFRDPIIYRIIQTPHHRTGTKWHCYPMYDFAHGQSDYFEGVTHSICTLEFVPHRPLYDKLVDFLKSKTQQQPTHI